jgi:hypothetical protein
MFKHKSLLFALIHLLLFLTFLTPFVVNSVFAQSIKPKIPEFTLKLVEHPYNAAPVTTKDPYTGETTITQEGYRATNRTIELSIKNQPFSPYKTSNDNYVNLCYNVSIKGHYDDKWTYYPDYWRKIPLTASQKEYTNISFGHDYDENDKYSYYFWIPDSGQLDFRVEALIGYYTEKMEFFPPLGSPIGVNTFNGQSSGWSNIQTITINNETLPSSFPSNTSPSNSNPSTSNKPNTDNPGLFGLTSWIGISLVILFNVIVVLLVIIVVYLRRKSISQFNNTLHADKQFEKYSASKNLMPLPVSTYFARHSGVFLHITPLG